MENKLPKAGCYRNVAEPFHCDLNHELFMGHLGNHMLNAADFHSSDRGFGMRYLNTVNKTWVLSRLVIEMKKMPRQYEEFWVETWVESAMRFFTNRNFLIKSADGESLGYGRSIWAMIDTETRQPCNILDIKDGELEHWTCPERTCPIEKPSRVKMTDGAVLAAEYEAKYSDIDVNGHVNSVKYIEHILDLFPVDFYRNVIIRRFDVAYVAESHYGDTLRLYREQQDEQTVLVSLRKVNGEGETECVRCKIFFEQR